MIVGSRQFVAVAIVFVGNESSGVSFPEHSGWSLAGIINRTASAVFFIILGHRCSPSGKAGVEARPFWLKQALRRRVSRRG